MLSFDQSARRRRRSRGTGLDSRPEGVSRCAGRTVGDAAEDGEVPIPGPRRHERGRREALVRVTAMFEGFLDPGPTINNLSQRLNDATRFEGTLNARIIALRARAEEAEREAAGWRENALLWRCADAGRRAVIREFMKLYPDSPLLLPTRAPLIRPDPSHSMLRLVFERAAIEEAKERGLENKIEAVMRR